MSRVLIVFGDQTADEIVCTANESCAEEFDSIRKIIFHDQIDSDTEFCNAIDGASDIKYIIGMIDVRLKPKVRDFAESRKLKPFSVIHPTAYVAPSAVIGDGTFIGPLAVVSVNANIGCHSVIHIHSSIGHDCQVGEFCAVLPGARISGNVIIEDDVMIGSGAFLFQGIRVGRRARVDALTYVRNDVAPNRTVSCRSGMNRVVE